MPNLHKLGKALSKAHELNGQLSNLQNFLKGQGYHVTPESRHPFDPLVAASYKKALRMLRTRLRAKKLAAAAQANKLVPGQPYLKGVPHPAPSQGPPLEQPVLKPPPTS
jgi:hypothetical protein